MKYDAFNPGKVWLDNNGRHINAHGAGAIFDGEKYYIFGEHKMGGTLGNKAVVGVHCYSSKDLYNWTDEGIALKMQSDPNSEIVLGTILERPKVIYNPKTKKYVMWMHLEFRKGPTAKSTDIADILKEKPDYSTARAGVAVADKITGPYKYIGSLRPNAGKYPLNCAEELKAYKAELEKDPNWKSKKLKKDEYKKAMIKGFAFLRDFDKGQMSRDMTLFVDDDSKAYLGCASEDNSTFHIHELNSDYTGFSGRFVRVFPGGYHEAPAFFKKGGKYYMFSSHCTGWAPNPDSKILKIAQETYRRLFGKEAKIMAIHAGLECGLFLTKYPHLDMISFGPTMREVHSPNERLKIETVGLWWSHLLEILKSIPAK